MEQLTLNDLYVFCQNFANKGFDLKEIQVYLGNDDELNGIHNGWFITPIMNKQGISENNDYFIDMINNDSHCSKLEMKGVVIS